MDCLCAHPPVRTTTMPSLSSKGTACRSGFKKFLKKAFDLVRVDEHRESLDAIQLATGYDMAYLALSRWPDTRLAVRLSILVDQVLHLRLD